MNQPKWQLAKFNKACNVADCAATWVHGRFVWVQNKPPSPHTRADNGATELAAFTNIYGLYAVNDNIERFAVFADNVEKVTLKAFRTACLSTPMPTDAVENGLSAGHVSLHGKRCKYLFDDDCADCGGGPCKDKDYDPQCDEMAEVNSSYCANHRFIDNLERASLAIR